MAAVAPTVLIAENDEVCRLFLADNLQADGYWPVCAADTSAALALLSRTPDALIVDVNGDTLGVIDAIREQTCPGIDPDLPILVLTSHTGELHRTRLLERGADDVLCKPYSYPELRARLGALLRRADARRTPQVLRAGSLRLDVRSRRAWVGEVEIEPLRGKEYQLLLALITEPERVLTKVNFELPKAKDEGTQGLRGSGRIGDPLFRPGSDRLTTALCPEDWAHAAGLREGPGSQRAGPHSRGRALRAQRPEVARRGTRRPSRQGARCGRTARSPSEQPHHVLSRLSSARARTGSTGARRRPQVRWPVSTDAAVRLTHSALPDARRGAKARQLEERYRRELSAVRA